MSTSKTSFVWLVTAACLAMGCSSTLLDPTSCVQDEECVAEFGPGSTCAENGFCVPLEACTSTADCQAAIGFGSVCEEGECVDVEVNERCAKTFPTDLWTHREAYRDYFVYGSLMDQSSVVHRGRENGMHTAAVVLNEAGGVDDRRFGIVFCDLQGGPDNPYDDGARPDIAVELAEWLVDTVGLTGLMGPASSGDTQRVYTEVIAPSSPQAVIVSPNSASPVLTSLDTLAATDLRPGLLWRTCSSAADQGPVIANDMAQRDDPSIQRVAIIREEGAFGEGVAQAFIESWTAMGGSSEQFVFPDGNASRRTEVIAEAGTRLGEFEAVLFAGQTTDATAFIAQASASSDYPDDIHIYVPQTGANPSVFAEAESTRLFTRVRAANQAVDTDSFAYKTFEAKFMELFDADPADTTFAPHSYDAMWLLALGSAWAATQEDALNGVALARGFRKTVGGAAEVQFTASHWRNAVTQLSRGNAIDVYGASGPLDFDPVTEEHEGRVELLQGTEAGTFEVILPGT